MKKKHIVTTVSIVTVLVALALLAGLRAASHRALLSRDITFTKLVYFKLYQFHRDSGGAYPESLSDPAFLGTLEDGQRDFLANAECVYHKPGTNVTTWLEVTTPAGTILQHSDGSVTVRRD